MAFQKHQGAGFILALLCLSSACLALSIEREPVRVTHRNSGPRYQVESLPTTSAPQTESASAGDNNKPPNEANNQVDSEADQMPVGHVSIRRIFLVPMMRPSRPDWQERAETSDSSPESRQTEPGQEQPSMLARPFWPFLMPPRPLHTSHLLGADEASRPPSAIRPLFHRDQDKAESGAEREGQAANERPTMGQAGAPDGHQLDPIQMMIEMMQQAMSGQLAPSMPNSPDLKKEESSSSSSEASEERPKSPTDMAPRPMKPSGQNETREDIVEIEGKKYLRKTVTNRHVGENIIFMTRRLIFVPLNETDSGSDEQPAITTTTSETSEAPSPVTTVAPPESSEKILTTTTVANEPPVESRTSARPVEEATTTTTTTSAPSTVSANEPTTTNASEKSAGKESIAERISSALEKAAERLVEGVTSPSDTTTEKPASS